jgi:hypothetical protein
MGEDKDAVRRFRQMSANSGRDAIFHDCVNELRRKV